MKNHAFLILAHNQPLLLKNLIQRLSFQNHHFFIHIDKRARLDSFVKELEGLSNVEFLESRYAVNWGSNYQVWATLDLLKRAFEKNIFGYYHLISGVDGFCSTNQIFDSFFENYLNRRTKLGDFICRYAIKFQRVISRVVPLRKSLPSSFKFYKGSQWFSFHEDFVQYIFDFLKENSWYRKCFTKTFCSDEDFFQTMLYNSPLVDRIVNDNLRYIDWTPTYPKENLPRVLDECDYEKIKARGCFFCRKIDSKKSGKLLELLNAVE